MAQMKFYAYNGSVSFRSDVFQPGEEIPLDVVKEIPRANLRTLLREGLIITQSQREAIEAAQRIADAKNGDRLPPIGCGKDDFMELPLSHGSTAGLGAAKEQLKEDRGEAPLREIEDFLDGKNEDFTDETAPPAPAELEDERVTAAGTTDDVVVESKDVPNTVNTPEEPDFTDEEAPEVPEGENDDPLSGMFAQDEDPQE